MGWLRVTNYCAVPFLPKKGCIWIRLPSVGMHAPQTDSLASDLSGCKRDGCSCAVDCRLSYIHSIVQYILELSRGLTDAAVAMTLEIVYLQLPRLISYMCARRYSWLHTKLLPATYVGTLLSRSGR